MPATRLICDTCGLRVWKVPRPEAVCEECGGPLRAMARLEHLVDRWFAPPEQVASRMHRRHMQLIELMWTADERGREFYDLMRPKGISYDRFVDRVTEVICQGLAEGWIEAQIPATPVPDDRAYAIHYRDPQRFADEVEAVLRPAGSKRAESTPG